jgi:protein-S-isoprenylcysteine O-methyltransferase Ste14
VLKVVIVLLLIGVVASIFSGLVFLFKDSDKRDSKRTLYALGIRISLAAALLTAVLYGFYTGELRMGTNAPWHADRHPETSP